MSATASPGRTWPIALECRMPNLASEAATALFYGGDRSLRLPDLAHSDPSAQPAEDDGEGGFGTQCLAQRCGGWGLDCAPDPV